MVADAVIAADKQQLLEGLDDQVNNVVVSEVSEAFLSGNSKAVVEKVAEMSRTASVEDLEGAVQLPPCLQLNHRRCY